MVWLWANITTAHVAKTGNRPQRRLVAKTGNRPGSRGPAICSLPDFPEFAQAVRYGVPGTHEPGLEARGPQAPRYRSRRISGPGPPRWFLVQSRLLLGEPVR